MRYYPVSENPLSELVRGRSPHEKVGHGLIDGVHQDRDQQIEPWVRVLLLLSLLSLWVLFIGCLFVEAEVGGAHRRAK